MQDAPERTNCLASMQEPNNKWEGQRPSIYVAPRVMLLGERNMLHAAVEPVEACSRNMQGSVVHMQVRRDAADDDEKKYNRIYQVLTKRNQFYSCETAV